MGFKKDFIWGGATASYQVEGAAYEDGKGLNIWDIFCKDGGHIYENQTGDAACDQYHRYKEDVQIMKEMGGGQGGNPFTFMSIDKIRHLSTSLSDAITGGEIALEEKEANDITKAMDVFIEKMSDSDIVDKVISILEEAESKNKEERS